MVRTKSNPKNLHLETIDPAKKRVSLPAGQAG